VAIRNISVDSDNIFQPAGLSAEVMANSFDQRVAAQVPVDTASGDEQLSIRVNITAAATR
jgi:hypothetical protein